MEQRMALLAGGREIASDTTEAARTIRRAEAARDFLLELDHAQIREGFGPDLLLRRDFGNIDQIAQEMSVAKAVTALPVPLIRREPVSDECSSELRQDTDLVHRRLTPSLVISVMGHGFGSGDVNVAV
jgi:hypothetical protein